MHKQKKKILSISLESKFASTASKFNKKKKKIISLGLGEPMFNTPDAIISSAYRAMKSGYTKYSDSKGLFELRDKISTKLKSENKISVDPDQIIITPGAKMALSISLASILEPGDEVINILPCYPSFFQQILIANSYAKVINLDLKKNDFSIDYIKLKKILSKKTKVIILNFPHNPTGKMLSLQELEKLKKILSKYKCWIISDEIYEYLNFNKKKHLSIAADENFASRCITINGFSKAYSMTGWRIGYLATKNKIINLMNKVHQNMNTNVATFTQKAAMEAISMKKKHLKSYNKQLKKNYDYIAKSLKESNLLSINPCDGGLFTFMNISKTSYKSDEFCNQLLKRFNVASIPGFYFGRGWNDHVRISLVETQKNFREGIRRLSQFEKLLLK